MTERGLGALAGSLGCFPLDDGTYLSPSISVDCAADIRSLPDVGTSLEAFGRTVLYLRQLRLRANPKVISGRTGYHQA